MTPNVFLDSLQYIYEKKRRSIDWLSRIPLFMKFLAFFAGKNEQIQRVTLD